MKFSLTRFQNFSFIVFFCLILGSLSGCNTLSSFGLSLGSSGNKMLNTTKEISAAEGYSVSAPKELRKEPLPTYIVEIGDTILIEAVKFDATIRLPGDQVIKPDGNISLGEFGEYMATGKTIEQIRIETQQIIDDRIRQNREIAFEIERRQRESDELRARRRAADEGKSNDNAEENSDEELTLSSIEDEEAQTALQRRITEEIRTNEISVRLVNWESKKIYVLGEVSSPGSFDYNGTHTVLDAILEAGGLSSNANAHQIVVARPSTCSSCRTVMKVCYEQIVQLGDTTSNFQLLPGDRVFVPSLTFLEDLKQSFCPSKDERCPQCSGCQTGCDLPNGCE